MAYSKKDLISTKDLTTEDIYQILSLAKDYKNLNLQNEKKSEEKIFRWGDYRADLVLFRGCGGLFWKYKTFCVGLYSVKRRETLFL